MIDFPDVPYIGQGSAPSIVPGQKPIKRIPSNPPYDKPIKIRNSLIHESFPSMGEEHRAHEGSQSESPREQEMY